MPSSGKTGVINFINKAGIRVQSPVGAPFSLDSPGFTPVSVPFGESRFTLTVFSITYALN